MKPLTTIEQKVLDAVPAMKTIPNICSALGFTRSRVRYAIKVLEHRGLIEIELRDHGRYPAEYRVRHK